LVVWFIGRSDNGFINADWYDREGFAFALHDFARRHSLAACGVP
jgi:hypothetical protein